MSEVANSLFKFLAYTPLFVALTGIALIYFVLTLLELPIHPLLLFITFLVVFSVYSINRCLEISDEDILNYPERVAFIKKHISKLKFSSFLLYTIAFITAILTDFWVAIFILIPLIVVILYTIKPFKLKKFFFIKNFVVAFTWALCLTILPLLFFKEPITLQAVFIFLFIFLKGIGNTITFDIRDMKGDRVHGISTIPILLGIEKTKKLLILINILSFIVLIIPALLQILSPVAYFVSLVVFYTFLYIMLIDKIDLKFLTDILADSEFIIIGILAFIGTLVT